MKELILNLLRAIFNLFKRDKTDETNNEEVVETKNTTATNLEANIDTNVETNINTQETTETTNTMAENTFKIEIKKVFNKYCKLALDFNSITCKYKDTSSPYSKTNPHKGVDFGYSKTTGNKVYAVQDGKVFKIGKSTGTGNSGNSIWIRHSFDSKYDLISRYCHLKDNSIKVKVGSNVTKGQQIAIMGNTYGYATHLHYEMWKVPKSWVYKWADRSKYLVNPLDYTFAYDSQTIGTNSASKAIAKVVGTSKQVARDYTKNQLQVIGYKLRCRKEAGTDKTIFGYINYGIYNFTEMKNANGYIWYKIADNMWVAKTADIYLLQ